MDLKDISNFELTQRMEKLVRTERKITHLILLHINEVESRKLYADLGYDGMFSYLTKGLGYSESSAYRRLQSARLLKQVPAVAEKLESGALNLSQLTQVQKCMKEEMRISGVGLSETQTQKILKEIEHKNTFETQKVLALEFNQPIQQSQIIIQQADESVRLEVTLSKEEFAELQKAREFLSHVCPDGSWSDVISTLARKFNKSKLGFEAKTSMPSCNAKKIENITSTQSFATTKVKAETQDSIKSQKAKRAYIPVNTKRKLLASANHHCQFKDKVGKACGSTYQLQIDHIFPKALGGTDAPENLRILCRTHNNLMAQKFGLKRSL